METGGVGAGAGSGGQRGGLPSRRRGRSAEAGGVGERSGRGRGGGLADEPTEGMEVEQEVGELDLLGVLDEAMGRQPLEAEMFELAVGLLLVILIILVLLGRI